MRSQKSTLSIELEKCVLISSPGYRSTSNLAAILFLCCEDCPESFDPGAISLKPASQYA